jgi:choline-sulfatase
MPRPNILIFMTDHQRADTVLSEHPAVAPNVDRFAAEGVTFTHAFCPSPHCCPSRATFVTGHYPSRHGVWNNVCNPQSLSEGVDDGVRMCSEDLADAGYDLRWSGKWHVSVLETPADHGWKEHYVSAHERYGSGSERWETYRRLAARPEPTERAEGQIIRPGYPNIRLYGERDFNADDHDERVTAEGVRAIRQAAADGGPWCVYAGAIGPHDPYFVPKRFLDLYDLDDVELPVNYADAMDDKPRIYQRMRRQVWDQLSEREIREAIRHFRACCSYLDDCFGKLLRALDETGQADDTLVVYTSDHGDYCGEHGLFAKGIPCFDGAYRVPAVMRWPKGIASPGRRVDALVSLADLAPTFTELAGGTPAADLAGRSLVPFLKNDAPDDWREEICTQCDGVELYFTQRSVRTHAWRYTFNGFDRDELYDLKNDPHEMANLADDPKFTDIKRDLVGRMWRFAHAHDDAAINGYITVGLAPWGPAEAFRAG